MNNEQQQIIDEAYRNYFKYTINGIETGLDKIKGYLDGCLVEYDGYYEHFTNPSFAYGYRTHNQEQFINKIKTDPEFSEKWGLKIEERELHSEERKTLYREHCMKNFWALKLHGTTLHYEHCMKDFWDLKITGINEVDYENANIPTKLITLTYKNKTIECYEN